MIHVRMPWNVRLHTIFQPYSESHATFMYTHTCIGTYESSSSHAFSRLPSSLWSGLYSPMWPSTTYVTFASSCVIWIGENLLNPNHERTLALICMYVCVCVCMCVCMQESHLHNVLKHNAVMCHMRKVWRQTDHVRDTHVCTNKGKRWCVHLHMQLSTLLRMHAYLSREETRKHDRQPNNCSLRDSPRPSLMYVYIWGLILTQVFRAESAILLLYARSCQEPVRVCITYAYYTYMLFALFAGYELDCTLFQNSTWWAWKRWLHTKTPRTAEHTTMFGCNNIFVSTAPFHAHTLQHFPFW